MLSIQGTSPRGAGSNIETRGDGGGNLNHGNAAKQQGRQNVTHVHNWAMHYMKQELARKATGLKNSKKQLLMSVVKPPDPSEAVLQAKKIKNIKGSPLKLLLEHD